MLAARFCEDFAETMARRVLEADAVATLYAVATGPAGSLPRPLRAKVAFRSAYVLERLYFRAPERFMPHADLFCERDFAAASGMSARRHFGKIMADLLLRFRPSDGALGRIAEAAAEWAVDPSSPVAVKVWALDVLDRCRGRVAWVAETWDDLLETLAREATPGIACRVGRYRKAERQDIHPVLEEKTVQQAKGSAVEINRGSFCFNGL